MLFALEFSLSLISLPLSESYYSSGSFLISSINFCCLISRFDCILLKLFLFLNMLFTFCFLFNISGGAIFPPSCTVSVCIDVYCDLICWSSVICKGISSLLSPINFYIFSGLANFLSLIPWRPAYTVHWPIAMALTLLENRLESNCPWEPPL